MDAASSHWPAPIANTAECGADEDNPPPVETDRRLTKTRRLKLTTLTSNACRNPTPDKHNADDRRLKNTTLTSDAWYPDRKIAFGDSHRVQ